jgi:tRNA threonylcarbamoyladenosine biosynthesis protein TsaE
MAPALHPSPPPADPAATLDLFLPDAAATDALGQRIAPLLRPGLPLLLSGPVGAGKSALARAAIRALAGQAIDVPSPTFTLVQTYDLPGGAVWHADLYRLSHPDEAEELGLIDAMESCITLIEWPDRLGAERPDGALAVTLAHDGDGRRAHLQGEAALIARLAQQ